ncbi:hypothetical protein K7S64_002141 [Listeria monocytogenes]|nr:hypothetical protein [Listeria monocytogenes]EIA6537584.1 hypothetical protein [Listeria monocytogenes]EIA6912776.1 hypothetical protein [Listeria monocytogenes]EIA6938917.1 hypothetical protein [Listeria monocytogenes]EIA6969378.1 hypothetical protein [Listeria monocytogenes]
MERYSQISNEAAARMILNGSFGKLWVKDSKDVVKCSTCLIRLEELPELVFFVKEQIET